MGNVPKEVRNKISDKDLSRQIAVINSMTKQERRFPDLIKGTRKKRIADGCGQDLHAVNQVLKQHQTMQKMMKRLTTGNIANMMRGMQGSMRGMR
jgi:signal recognition particle subunit SRP54